MRTLIAIVPVMLISLASCANNSASERDIQVLATTSSAWDAAAAAQRLRAAGASAFPALVARLDDETTVPSNAFDAREIVTVYADGTCGPYRASVGTVCFELIQYMIYGSGWPKAFRGYFAFTEDDVAVWLSRHRGSSLEQMREAASAESIARIDKALVQSPDSEFLQDARRAFQRHRLAAPN